ncbi:anthranilate synthase component 1 [Lecanora helva]
MAPKFKVQPSLSTVQDILHTYEGSPNPPNVIPICATIAADILTPTLAYLRISKSNAKHSFMFESAANSETIGRYSFVGASADPRKILTTGPGHGPEDDPLPLLQKELAEYREAIVPGLTLPPLTGGAIGYVGYDCVRYFEPKTARPMKDVLRVPESLFMLFDTIIAFDHFFQVVKIITYLSIPAHPQSIAPAYDKAYRILRETISTIQSTETPLPEQPPIVPGRGESNKGKDGYEKYVLTLKDEIQRGSIIQAVPSHRFSQPTTLHPFNIYRQLRTTNPSPYLFYINCSDFQLVGASPELLVKREPDTHRIITHPIAGTVKRGTTLAEDLRLADELRASLKDRAEHVMLVDLARNDINRVCDPLSTRVDRLMVVEKFSHVQHLVSQVSGLLREDQTRFDAFRSIFPAGTVSGAPKVRAMELIAELEKERRGVYAGAVGYFGYGNVDREGKEVEGAMDTCIALRTMLVKDGTAFLQAGGGIVWDSVPEEEWEETMNKLAANLRCIKDAEARFNGEGLGEPEKSTPHDQRKVHI